MVSVGFEPTRPKPADLKSAPLDHSGTCPEMLLPRLELGLTAHKTVVLTTILYVLNSAALKTSLSTRWCDRPAALSPFRVVYFWVLRGESMHRAIYAQGNLAHRAT